MILMRLLKNLVRCSNLSKDIKTPNIPESVLLGTIQAKMHKERRKGWNIEKLDKKLSDSLKVIQVMQFLGYNIK